MRGHTRAFRGVSVRTLVRTHAHIHADTYTRTGTHIHTLGAKVAHKSQCADRKRGVKTSHRIVFLAYGVREVTLKLLMISAARVVSHCQLPTLVSRALMGSRCLLVVTNFVLLPTWVTFCNLTDPLCKTLFNRNGFYATFTQLTLL